MEKKERERERKKRKKGMKKRSASGSGTQMDQRMTNTSPSPARLSRTDRAGRPSHDSETLNRKKKAAPAVKPAWFELLHCRFLEANPAARAYGSSPTAITPLIAQFDVETLLRAEPRPGGGKTPAANAAVLTSVRAGHHRVEAPDPCPALSLTILQRRLLESPAQSPYKPPMLAPDGSALARPCRKA